MRLRKELRSDPPLEETDIPMGEWMCHSCKYALQKLDVTTTTSATPQQRSKRSASTPATSMSSVVAPKPSKKAKANPMEVLVQAAMALNPRQFELPRSMSVPCIFPGRDKGEILEEI